MTAQLKLTKRQLEVAEMMRDGWNLYVQPSLRLSGKPKAFLVRSEGALVTGNQKISWTVVEALEKARVVKPIGRSSENAKVWRYSLANAT